MKHFTLGQLLVGALLLGGFLSATATPTVTPLKGKAQDVSPDGLTVVGFYDQEWNEDWTIQFHESFVWDGVNGQQWKTSYDGDDCMESGLFFGVTDTGIITGAVKNDGMRLPANGGGGFKPGLDRQGPEREEELGEPIFTAAVWRDGNLEMLSEGLGSISDYNEPNDGTYAVAASEDGSTVIGYYYKNWMADGAIVWKYNNLCYCFDLVDYAMPDGILSSVMLGISRDGSIIYGNVIKPTPDGGKTVPVYWPSSESCVEIELPKGDYALGCGTAAMSPDGRRILVNGSGYDRMFLGIYNTDTNTLEEIRLPEKTQTVTGYAVTDNGGVFFNVRNKDWESVNYYYSCESGSMMSLESYLEEAAPEISDEDLRAVLASTIVKVSGDGRTIIFNQDMAKSLVLQLDKAQVVSAPAPNGLNLYYSAPETVTLEWNGVSELPEGVTLVGYQAYIDGEPLGDVVETTQAGGLHSISGVAEMGRNHSATVRTLYMHEGEEKMSSEADPVETYVSASTALIEFDNFDDSSIDPNGNIMAANDHWTTEIIEGNMLVISWHLDVRDWDNNNPFATVLSAADSPWANAYVSHYRDASDADDFFLSFYTQIKEVNELGQDRSTDFLDVQYTLDGKNWETIETICAADMDHAKWIFHKVDLGDKLAGKIFRLRFNAHGEGKAQLMWALDCIGINDVTDAPQPTGLRAEKISEGNVSLTWQNTMGAWDLSHVINSYVEYSRAIGNEAAGLMAAVDMDSDRIRSHAGEYISGVSAFIYDAPEMEYTPTEAEAVIFEDGVEVARGRFCHSFDKVISSTAWLDSPVLIQDGKSYRVAVDILAHDSENAPMYYQNTDEAVAGVTDLFSEDGGKTWQTMRETYDNLYPGDDEESLRALGNCIWSIHANITSEGEKVADDITKDSEIIGYNVYRDGERINKSVVFAPYMRYDDKDAPKKAEYQVEAYYRDGRVSPLSEPLKIDMSGVCSITANDVKVTREGSDIIISGDFRRATLIDMSGKRVISTSASRISTATLPAGVYVLQVSDGVNDTLVKIMVR